ncbi:MAG TPA: protocatechuate 3,4-dioxygenase [Caulobacteraceae bacterium]|jgi:protocatechuate 3,4-dioxygenase beta subunit|nr:protocatechuate 3,4-dioxygenase [Caulobacteraceae bacterium]
MILLDRRHALLGAALALAAGPAFAAAALRPTPAETEGPFYPDKMPAETDPDLVHVGRRALAGGELLDLRGAVLDRQGRPIPGVMVEIWQVDANGRYIHTADASRGGRDEGFQGFGRTFVDAQGAYAFRTIRPVPYPGRTPHIHYKVYRPGGRVLTTQMVIAGEPRNEQDDVYLSTAPGDRPLIAAELRRQGDGWATRFDIVLA